jgi:hypothetical protein
VLGISAADMTAAELSPAPGASSLEPANPGPAAPRVPLVDDPHADQSVAARARRALRRWNADARARRRAAERSKEQWLPHKEKKKHEPAKLSPRVKPPRSSTWQTRFAGTTSVAPPPP